MNDAQGVNFVPFPRSPQHSPPTRNNLQAASLPGEEDSFSVRWRCCSPPPSSSSPHRRAQSAATNTVRRRRRRRRRRKRRISASHFTPSTIRNTFLLRRTAETLGSRSIRGRVRGVNRVRRPAQGSEGRRLLLSFICSDVVWITTCRLPISHRLSCFFVLITN